MQGLRASGRLATNDPFRSRGLGKALVFDPSFEAFNVRRHRHSAGEIIYNHVAKTARSDNLVLKLVADVKRLHYRIGTRRISAGLT